MRGEKWGPSRVPCTCAREQQSPGGRRACMALPDDDTAALPTLGSWTPLRLLVGPCHPRHWGCLYHRQADQEPCGISPLRALTHTP